MTVARVIREPRRGLSAADLRRVRLFIGTPCYLGQIGLAHAHCVQELCRLLTARRIGWILSRPNGEMVARARNRLVAEFIGSECTHLLFLDSDISFRPADILTLLRANLHVVGAIYPKKTFDWSAIAAAARRGVAAEHLAEAGLQYCFNPLQARTTASQGTTVTFRAPGLRGCMEVAEIGTGCLLIQRRAITRMMRAHPELEYRDDYAATYGRRTWALFDYGVEGHRYLSEDYRFCARWRAIGGRVWAAINVPLAHTGTYVFRGEFARRIKPTTACSRASVRRGAPLKKGT